MVVGGVKAFDWQGSTINTTESFYLYNVGIGGFFTHEGKIVPAAENADKWTFTSTSAGKITTNVGNKTYYIRLDYGWGWRADVVDSNTSSNITIESGSTAGSYRFSYDARLSSKRYFNMNSATEISAASSTGPLNEFLLITDEEVARYNASGEITGDAPEAGEFYIQHALTKKYLKFGAQNLEMADNIGEATAFTINGNTSTSISSDGKYVYQSKGDNSVSNSSLNWTLTNTGFGYYISSQNGDRNNRTRYLSYDGAISVPDNATRNSFWFFIKKDNVKTANLTVNAAAGYGTFIAPFEVTLPAGVTAYQVDHKGSSWVSLKSVANGGEKLAANTPVILKSSNGANTNYYGNNVGSSNEHSDGFLTGVYERTDVETGKYLLQVQNGEVGFYPITSGTLPVAANRCYLTLPEAGIKGFSLRFEDADGIDTIIEQSNDNRMYDLSGRQISKPQHGFYIKNGKKYFVK